MSFSVVIGIGNPYRRDDGVGPAVAAELAGRPLPGVRVISCPAEPTAILDAWDGAQLAVVIDAAVGGSAGTVRLCDPAEVARSVGVSSHDLDLRQTIELARALGRSPQSLVIVTVDVVETGHGSGLTDQVAAALPEAVRVVLAVLDLPQQAEETTHQVP